VNVRPKRMDKAGWDWFNVQVPVLTVEDSCGMVAVDEDTGEYVGGVVFDNWTDTSVMAHFCITSAAVLRSGFYDLATDYVFEERGRRMIFASVPSQYEKALKFLPKVGFIEQFRLKDAFKEGIDCVILELKKENVVRIVKEAA
jgi:RimJ/RimL family protein N-acetyltransferase